MTFFFFLIKKKKKIGCGCIGIYYFIALFILFYCIMLYNKIENLILNVL